METLPPGSKIVIDETQKLPSILDEVQALMFDYDERYIFRAHRVECSKAKADKCKFTSRAEGLVKLKTSRKRLVLAVPLAPNRNKSSFLESFCRPITILRNCTPNPKYSFVT